MPLIAFLFTLITFVPMTTAFFARSLGRPFWKWFAIGCVLPFISVIILFFIDKPRQEQD